MKIEFKKDSFKTLYYWLSAHKPNDNLDKKIGECPQVIYDIFVNEIRPQYNKNFKKYYENPTFKVGDKVRFLVGFNKNDIGKIVKVYKRGNGRYYYIVKYSFQDSGGEVETHSNPILAKNLVLINE